MPDELTPGGALWPPRPDLPTVLLLDVPTAADREALDAWLAKTRATLSSEAELHVARSAAEAVRLAEPGDASIAPVRVAWLPPGQDGDRRWRRRDLLKLRRRVGLSARERQRILSRERDRCRIVVGDAARLSELRSRMRKQSSSESERALVKFVESQARLALDRRERAVTGARYKVPQDVKDQMVGGRRFEAGIAMLAERLGRPSIEIRAEALGYLEEMACTQSPLMRELWARWSRTMYARAYELCFEEAAIERLRKLGDSHPLVFLPTHKSNLDGYVLSSLLYEQGFPPNHTLGGINMAFWPLGPVGRRVGVIWIRRTITDNPVYRWVLRQYLAYLVGKRFNLEWYIEGGRTRTGKLLPPKMGLLRYLVDAIEEAGIEDVYVIPVSIVYDQLEEVAEMTAESHGAVKPAEGLRWLIDYARRQSRAAGRVQVGFGEPLGVSSALLRHGVAEDRRLALSKLAFDVCTRINRVTPVTSTGLVTLALLGVDGRSLTAVEVSQELESLLRYAEARALPGVGEIAELATTTGIEAALARLLEHGVVSCFERGREPVYSISGNNELVAAFYRNSVIHWFLNRSIVELALVRAAEAEPGPDQVEVAWAEAFRLRDVLKFEFFFADKDGFQDELRDELALIEPAWRSVSDFTLADVGRALADSGALMAHRVLSSFLESYYVVAECLLGRPTNVRFEQRAFLSDCLAFGEQLRLQHRITSAEAVSTELFRSALKLAENRGLLESANPELGPGRTAFAAEFGDLVRRMRVLAQISRAQHEAEQQVPAVAVGA